MDRRTEIVKIKSFHMLQPGDEENLKRALAMIGPVTASIFVTSNLFFYHSGVFFDTTCQGFRHR